MGISKRDLSQAYTDYYHKYGGNKEDYFPLLYISKEFRRPVEEVAHLVAFGGNDYGIDAFFIDRETRNLYLYQFKWAENHNLFKDSFKRIIDSGMERVFGNPIQDKNQNQLLLQLKAAIHESQSIIERVLIHFVFNGDPGAAEQSVVLDSLREDLESKKYLIDQYFSGRQITLTFQFISNQTKKLAVSHLKKTYQYDVKIPECIVAETHNDELMNIGFMPILIFYEMYRDMGLRLFERNIRAGLSSDRPANRALRRALNRIVLEEQDPPEIFAFNHNGVTLAVENCEKLNGIMKLTEPRILNGAQTVITLVRFMEENQGNKKLEKNIEFLN